MPSEWMRWVWDMEEGEQAPEFTSETQAQRILSLLMRYANDIAVTLTQAPQDYEPLFLEHEEKGRIVSIVDEWCCGYLWVGNRSSKRSLTGSRSSTSMAPKAGGTS